MECLVPLDTSNFTYTPPDPPVPPTASTIVISQTLANGVNSVTFNLTSYEFTSAPSNILPQIVKSDGTKSNIFPISVSWSATSFTCDLTSLTDDATYVCVIQITP